MWYQENTPHFGSFYLKKWLTFVTVILMVSFMYALISGGVVHAADAAWKNNSIEYNGTVYNGPATSNGDGSTGLHLGKGVKYYYADKDGKRKIIYFDANKDPTESTKAHFVEYDFSPPDSYSNQTSPKAITIAEKDGESNKNNDNQTSCAVNGIGYILCPIMSFISDGMDWVFEQVKSFLEIRPLSTDTDSSLFRAWNMMRSFANIGFVIAFLVFVYSYLTGIGVSQYDLRKMIPRLIIAAVVVNISYFICALLVDISNVAGASLQDLFLDVRNHLASTNTQTNKLDGISWSSMTTYILSGGTIAAVGLTQLSAVGTGIIYMLVPVLVMAAMAILVAVAVLAARQALIVILIIIAPIAFVAFSLPGTEKYFDKWRNLFQTMLLIYPMFSVLFGGSQLAGYLIAQNAQRPEVLVLAMFVQVMPLAITPFLIKISGGLLGKIAGMVNNPAKGVGDKAKNWASDKKDLTKARRIASNSKSASLARGLDSMRRRDEALKKQYESKRGRKFNSSSLGRRLARRQMLEDDRSSAVDNLNRSNYEELKLNDPKIRTETTKMKIAEMELNVNKAKAEAYLEEIQTNAGANMYGQSDLAVRALSSRMNLLAEEQQTTSARTASAQSVRNVDYAKRMAKSSAMQLEASGVRGDDGKILAAARATQTIREDFSKGISAGTELMKHYSKGLDNKSMERLALGEDVDIIGRDSRGNEMVFNTSSGGEIHEAAVTKYMAETNYAGAKKIVKAAGNNPEMFTSLNGTIKDAVASKFTTKAPFWSGQSLDIIDQGKAGDQGVNKGGFEQTIKLTVQKGKMGSGKLAAAEAAALGDLHETLSKYAKHGVDTKGGIASYDGFKRNDFDIGARNIVKEAQAALDDEHLQDVIVPATRAKLEELAKLKIEEAPFHIPK